MTGQTESSNDKSEPRPLLSICIPTSNRANFLKLMLQALLPQVRECRDLVEVWVLDNASEDNTQEVIQQSQSLGPLKVKRQTSNLGPTKNIVEGPAKLANGKYTWVLGDHNLLRPGALKYILNRLIEHSEFDVFYVNYRAASYPDHWPEATTGGHDGPFNYIGNSEIVDGPITKWNELLKPQSALCTQNYVHIVTTSTWKHFWNSIEIGKDYSSALTTYPHTMMLIETHLNSQAMVISEPYFTIFNGAQSWGNPETKLKVYFNGLTELISTLDKKGFPQHQIRRFWEDFFYPESRKHLFDLSKLRGRFACLSLFFQHGRDKPWAWAVLVRSLPNIFTPKLHSIYIRIQDYTKNYKSWYIYNCRPARWLRKQFLQWR